MVWFWSTFLHQIFYGKCSGHKGIIKMVRAVFASVGFDVFNTSFTNFIRSLGNLILSCF